MAWTNRGKYLMLNSYLAGSTPPTTFYAALCSNGVTPTAGTNTLGQLQEIPAGNGYTAGGIAVSRDAIGFPSVTQNDILNEATATLQDVSWTATGGSLPTSGNARYLVLTDDNATIANRQVIAYWDLLSNEIVSVGFVLSATSFLLKSKDAA